MLNKLYHIPKDTISYSKFEYLEASVTARAQIHSCQEFTSYMKCSLSTDTQEYIVTYDQTQGIHKARMLVLSKLKNVPKVVWSYSRYSAWNIILLYYIGV